MSSQGCPYHNLPKSAYWRDTVSRTAKVDINPQGSVRFQFDRSSKIATAGSCFAQHISRLLRDGGYNVVDTEPAPAWLAPEEREKYQYGIYSARFGNIYTAAQLLQLFRRAYGRFSPSEPAWEHKNRFIDPFRPNVHPGGFSSMDELLRDREQHLAAARDMFQTADILIFTLGLTEAWISNADGAVFPLCPGCPFGEFDPVGHTFHNFQVDEVVAQLDEFVAELRAVNTGAKILLTVSPVPLVATYEDGNVVQSTVYSKSVLRVAAEQIRRKWEQVDYFASYEIVTSTGNNASYFAADQRSVTKDAVTHVARVFFQSYTIDGQFVTQAQTENSEKHTQLENDAAVCDEDLLMEALAGKQSQQL